MKNTRSSPPRRQYSVACVAKKSTPARRDSTDKVGFVSSLPSEKGIAFFRYETRCIENCAAEPPAQTPPEANICVPGKWAGNSNIGHEGKEYGTDLSPEDKDAIVEYLKTF